MKTVFILLSLFLITTMSLFAQKTITLEELRNMSKKKNETKTEKTETPKNEMPKDIKVAPRPPMTIKFSEAETLTVEGNPTFEDAFIYVARTKEEFAKLSEMVGGIKTDKQIDFSKQAVVAGFAGEKNTGGHSVKIRYTGNIVQVVVESPEPGSMVTQAITYPFQVGIVPFEEEDSLNVSFSHLSELETKTYRLTSGEFEYSGGFIGIEKKFQAEGKITVVKSGDFVTLIFELRGKGEDAQRHLFETVSGKMDGHTLKIQRLEAGDFINRPHPPFDVSIKFKENKLTMKFEPDERDYVVSDGYEGRGYLEAVLEN